MDTTSHPDAVKHTVEERLLPAVAIMAGGKSQRMGRDKAELEIDGQTLLDRLIDQANMVSDTVLVIGRTDSRDDVIWLEDDEPGLGPLGGLRTALSHLDRPVLLVACDMPLVDADALQWLLDAFAGADAAHGLATTRDSQLEPLFSIYNPAVMSLVDERLSEGRRSVRGLIQNGDFERVETPEEIAPKLANVNTPGEFDAIR